MTSKAGNKFLIESALLAHGLPSLSDKDMLAAWPRAFQNIAWVEKGRVVIGSLEEFLAFRASDRTLIRIDCNTLDKARSQGISGALTASGTMALCAELGLPLAVTCGMGGIGDIKGEELCPDLPALADLPVALISTSPKDMLDIDASISWLKQHGVSCLGRHAAICDGYVFRLPPVQLDGIMADTLPATPGRLLILNPIPPERRLDDPSLLAQAVQVGHEAEAQGRYFHPAVNGELDRLSSGRTSRMQFRSLADNAELAAMLTAD